MIEPVWKNEPYRVLDVLAVMHAAENQPDHSVRQGLLPLGSGFFPLDSRYCFGVI